MNDSPQRRPIHSDAGGFISREEMDTLCQNYDNEHASQKSMGTHVKAMCFGRDKVIELLSQPGATALRIYYGLKVDTNGDGIKEKKMVLVAVDENGNDILPPHAAQDSNGNQIMAKSMAAQAVILDGGLPCPQYCTGNPPPPPPPAV
ncbi:hypothetical protein [Chitinophaga vietnamensis]|uniref:hypothetical protein n=1 Tax=Chitinophaga vietnamensis TaxID=2593957 RepID=UPI001178B62B|nr:hypothetical protein [Chitinophaga vietnamensis]